MSDRKSLVVLSGGLDSTYLLWQKLKQGDVHVCYFKASQSHLKIPMELEARRKTIKFFEELTGNAVVSDTIVDLGRDVWTTFRREGMNDKTCHNHVPEQAWGQAHLWFHGMLHVTDSRMHTEVCMGNVMGDTISLHLQDMKQAWQSLSAFCKRGYVPLEFPLAYITKDQILAEMPMEVFPHMWVCDRPIEKEGVTHPCSECQACNTMRKTIWHWEHVKGRSFQKSVEQHVEWLAEEKERQLNPPPSQNIPIYDKVIAQNGLSTWNRGPATTLGASGQTTAQGLQDEQRQA